MPPGGPAAWSSDFDFALAFNNSNFSDRVLRIEIIPDSPEIKSDSEASTNLSGWAGKRKRRRGDVKRDNAVDSLMHREEQILSCRMPDTEEGARENQEEEAVAMVEDLPSGVNTNQLGDEAAHSDDSSLNGDCLAALEVKTMHICSAILAAKSPSFYKKKQPSWIF